MSIKKINRIDLKIQDEINAIHAGNNIQLSLNNGDFMAGYYSNNEMIGYIYTPEPIGNIYALYVRKDYQKNRELRVGESLLQFLISEARNQKVTKLDLGVTKDNKNVISFYEKYGFKVTGESSNGITKMSLDLKQ